MPAICAMPIIGMIIGGLISLREAKLSTPQRPLAAALALRAERVSDSFRRVVFAQFWIAGLNTLFTGLYLTVALPLMGVELPLTKTLIVVTFVCGLLPVLGNLISNTVIVLVSLSNSVFVAVGAGHLAGKDSVQHKLGKYGIRTARVVQERAEVRGQVLKLAALDDSLRARLDELKAGLGGKSLRACR